jgi:hypothetical protein
MFASLFPDPKAFRDARRQPVPRTFPVGEVVTGADLTPEPILPEPDPVADAALDGGEASTAERLRWPFQPRVAVLDVTESLQAANQRLRRDLRGEIDLRRLTERERDALARIAELELTLRALGKVVVHAAGHDTTGEVR